MTFGSHSPAVTEQHVTPSKSTLLSTSPAWSGLPTDKTIPAGDVQPRPTRGRSSARGRPLQCVVTGGGSLSVFSQRACFPRRRVTYSVYNGANKLSRGSGACPPPAQLPEMSCRVWILFLCSKTIHRCVNGGITPGLVWLGMKNRRCMCGCVTWAGGVVPFLAEMLWLRRKEWWGRRGGTHILRRLGLSLWVYSWSTE